MLDIVDKVIKNHIQSMATIDRNPIPVFSIATADQDDQPMTQAGLANGKPDRIQLPFISLIRLPNIDITDDYITKRVHNYNSYKLFKDRGTMLTYYRATLHYAITLFAENRKVSEDIMTSIYASLRNNCQITVTIQLPIKDPTDDSKYVGVQFIGDIVMGASIEQINPIDLTKTQLYKCRIPFDVQNVNIYNIIEDIKGQFNIIIQSKMEGGEVVTEEVIYKEDNN